MSIKVRKKKLSDGRESVYLDIYTNGKRRYEFPGIYLDKNKENNKEKMALANKIRAQRELELAHISHGFIPEYKQKTDFVEYLKKKGEELSEKHSRSLWRNVHNQLKKFTGGSIEFRSIDKGFLIRFMDSYNGKVKDSTINRYAKVLKAAMVFAVNDNIITHSPFEYVKLRHEKNPDREHLTLEEVKKLSETPCPNKEVKRAFLFSCFAGLRFSDSKALKWKSITKENWIKFKQEKTDDFECLPLHKTAVSLIRNGGEEHGQEDLVFNLPTNGHSNFVIKKWVKDAGIEKNISFHTSRHTFACLLTENGVDLKVVSKLMGHKSIVATEIYAKMVDKRLVEGTQAIPAIEIG